MRPSHFAMGHWFAQEPISFVWYPLGKKCTDFTWMAGLIARVQYYLGRLFYCAVLLAGEVSLVFFFFCILFRLASNHTPLSSPGVPFFQSVLAGLVRFSL